MSTAITKAYKDLALKWGIIMAIILVAIRNSVWIINPDTAFEQSKSSMLTVISLIIFLVFLAYIGFQARKQTGFITSKLAFRTLAISILAYAIIGFAVDAAMFAMNKEKIEQKMEELKEETYTKMEERGMTDEQIEQSMKWFDMFKPSVLFIFLVSLVKLGFNMLIALIMAQIVKRNPPEEIEVEPETT